MDKINWKIKDNVEEQGGSDGFWYDLTIGGYINPEEILADEYQLKRLKEAISLVRDFELTIESAGILTEF